MDNAPKRRFTRINLDRKARLACGEADDSPCRIKNLSLGGMYISSRAAKNRGSRCSIFFTQAAPGSDLAIRAKARVVRAERDGMAMEFTAMSYDSYMFLQMLLLHEAEDPMVVSLEYANPRPFRILTPDSASGGQEASGQ